MKILTNIKISGSKDRLNRDSTSGTSILETYKNIGRDLRPVVKMSTRGMNPCNECKVNDLKSELTVFHLQHTMLPGIQNQSWRTKKQN